MNKTLKIWKLGLAGAVLAGSLALSGCTQGAVEAQTLTDQRVSSLEVALQQRIDDIESRHAKDSDAWQEKLERQEQINGKLADRVAKLEERSLALHRQFQSAAAAPSQPESAVPQPEAAPEVPGRVDWAVDSQWRSNGRAAIKVDKVEVVQRWADVGKLIRVDDEAREGLQGIQAGLDSGEYKVVVVHMQARNDSDDKLQLGYNFYVGGWTTIFLRGDEGSEASSRETYGFNIENDYHDAGSRLTRHLPGCFPRDAEVAPGAVIGGKVAYVVPAWFEPAKVFTKPNAANWGSPELVVDVAQK